jgi:tetratricopeptide (TPR) repeat protein
MAHVTDRDFEDYRHVMPGIYGLQDDMLGKLVASAGADTTVIVLSDHGFHSDHLRPRVQAAVDDPHAAMDATWHRPHGMLVMAGPGIRRGAAPHAPGLLDIAPTVLTLLGLPIGSDMDGRVLHEALDPAAQVERIPSWEDAAGPAGMHPAELRIDPFEARDAMKQLEDLGYLAAPEEGRDPLVECDRETRFNLGVVYMTTGRPQQAADVFERLHAEAADDRRFAGNLAHCWYALGRADEALAILDGLVGRFPDSADATLMRSALMLARGDAAGAASALERAASQNPDRVEVLCSLGEAYTRLERWLDAERVLARASQIDPHNPQASHRRARLALARGRFEEAAEHALNALELRHLFPEAHHTLGVALAWGGEHAHAIRSFEVALSMQPGLAGAHRFVAALHEHLGNSARARPHRESAERLEATRDGGGAPPASDPHGADAWAARHPPK